MIINCLIVGLGGALGALTRYGISIIVPHSLPIPTLIVNVVGSFILGYATTLLHNKRLSSEQMLFIGTGYCGGLTTMSTFSMETFNLWHDFIPVAFFYVLSTSMLGLIAVLFGMKLGEGNRRIQS
ncbi:fluoride efflux transporter CrcB [Bacillus sp. JJ722]|uniref:fluoride efflux transporter CrcB n=1 Tax=Bacillus sp. JJ722 TaxID=3122973 RepID=UPI002FFF54F0